MYNKSDQPLHYNGNVHCVFHISLTLGGKPPGLVVNVVDSRQAMVLGRGFESRLHHKTRCKDGPLDGRKIRKRQ